LVVSPPLCSTNETGAIADSICIESWGGLFNSSQSETWHNLGDYTIGLEANLDYNNSGTYGLDSISLGFSNAAGLPTLGSQVVVGIATDDYDMGVFGLGVHGTDLITYNATKPTYLTALKDTGLIPSLSWGYTAGAKYRK